MSTFPLFHISTFTSAYLYRVIGFDMKYYIIAGEASGDLHGSNLIKELKKLDTAAHIRCWGGDKMQAAGADLVKHYRQLIHYKIYK